MDFENVCEGLRRELACLIRLEDLGSTINGDGFLESLDAEVRIDRVG